MLQLRVYGRAEVLAAAGRELEDEGSARHLAVTRGLRADSAVLTGDVTSDAADRVLRHLIGRGIPEPDMALTCSDDIAPVDGGPAAALIWADALGQAARNSRPVARFLVFMVTAGVNAGFGVIEVNTILIVGAMAVSPDALPITAACIGLVSRRAGLAGRALAMLGLGAAALAACVLTVLLDLLDQLPEDFVVGESALSGLTSVNATTVGVAAAAGVAGMLALETRTSAGVGVAPASGSSIGSPAPSRSWRSTSR